MLFRLSIFGILISAITLLVVSFLAGHPAKIQLLNADALYLPTLFSDVLHGDGHIADWYLTPAPYFFPDFLLFLLAYLLGKSIYLQIATYIAIQALLTFILIYFLIKQLYKKECLFISILAFTILAWCALNALEPLRLMLISAHHYGVFMMEILFFTLFISSKNCKSTKYKRYNTALLAVIAGLCLLSDTLFIPQMLVPVYFLFVLINDVEDKKEDSHAKYLTKSFPWFLGFFVFLLILEIIFNRHLGENFKAFYLLIHAFYINTPILFIFICSYYLFSFVCLTFLLKQKLFLNLNKELIYLITFCLLSTIISLAAVLFVRHNVAIRYLIPAFSWPIIAGTILFACFLKNKISYLSLPISLIVLYLMTSTVHDLIQKNGIAYDFYPNYVACIDNALAEAEVKRGIAQYWDAKHLQGFSRYKIVLAQYVYNNHLKRYEHITSNKYFKSSYDFAIISKEAEDTPGKISQAQLISISGQPQKTIVCDNHILLIYNKGGLAVS
ncbi:hypothetical protein [Legionella brunensis]|uniref:Glycosyltransferase RgtA/B/C/D-like domain-containing protein n=1 Tax=Legionella brunensis TaxID=29422 RepID=A0A0W0S3W7_9GAMM|nr:hypothetical protein [Legionella brunensis]KTC78158.1 hypothetical protein Lbru_2450 [Legionella brunensis]